MVVGCFSPLQSGSDLGSSLECFGMPFLATLVSLSGAAKILVVFLFDFCGSSLFCEAYFWVSLFR